MSELPRLRTIIVGCVGIVGLMLVFWVLGFLVGRAHAASGVECGLASVYGVRGDGWAGGPTASGERMRTDGLTAAHRTLPFGSYVAVRSMAHLGSRLPPARVVVRINDRGPFVRGRVIDLSTAAARELGFADSLLPVCLEVL